MSSMKHKLVMLGDGGVGKSCLSIQFIHNYFTNDYDPTIENSYRKTVTVDEIPCLLEILDTAGQEDFIAMRDQHIRYGEGFALVFSITNRASFIALKDHYDTICRVKETDDIPIVLIANKCDLEGNRVISTAEGKQFAKSISAPFFETSAKTRFNVDEGYEELVRLIRKHNKKHPPKEGGNTSSSGGSKIKCIIL